MQQTNLIDLPKRLDPKPNLTPEMFTSDDVIIESSSGDLHIEGHTIKVRYRPNQRWIVNIWRVNKKGDVYIITDSGADGSGYATRESAVHAGRQILRGILGKYDHSPVALK